MPVGKVLTVAVGKGSVRRLTGDSGSVGNIGAVTVMLMSILRPHSWACLLCGLTKWWATKVV